MHVLFLCHEYPPPVRGGIGAFTQTLGRRLVANGHRVTVIGVQSRGPIGEQDDRGVHVVRLPSAGPRHIRAFLDNRRLWDTVRRLADRDPVDVIDGPELSFWRTPASLGIPCALRMNGGHHFFAAAEGRATRPLRAWIERASFQRAEHLSAVTHFVAERTRALMGWTPRPVEILPNPIDTDLFAPRPDVVPVPGRILFIGTVCEKKGIRHLIEALPRIRAQVPQAHLMVAGREWFDPDSGASYTEGLLRLIPAELVPHVTFLGGVDHEALPALIASAEACACPSLMESQGIVWGEVMAMGRPLVASSLGPGPEVVTHGEGGLLCDPEDGEALAGAVTRLLVDASLREQLGRRGRELAVARFSVESLVRANERWFERILAAHRA